MRRILTCALTLAMLLTLSLPARADILWEPRDNSFFEAHRAGCSYEGRSYYANSPDGFVTAWDAPKGSMVRAQYENGESLWVGYIYGNDWALISRWGGGDEISGWIPLADLTLVYDNISFSEEYADRITPYNGEFADYTGTPKVINFYKYPGAPEIGESFNTSLGDVLSNLTGSEGNRSYISSIFVDENGLTWGYVGYLYGIRSVWFCLDEPDGENFPVRDVSQSELIPARDPTLPTRSDVPYILVAVAVLATAGILFRFYGKKRRSTK